MVQDADTDVLESLRDLVGGVDVFLGRITLLSGVKPRKHQTERHQNAQLRFLLLADGLIWLEHNRCRLRARVPTSHAPCHIL